MSNRRRSSLDNYHSPEPIVIERDPQVRSHGTRRPAAPAGTRLTFGSKLYNLFRSRRQRVHIIEEAPVRTRPQVHRRWTPSPPPPPPPPPPHPPLPPSPPLPPRGPYYTMSPKLEDEIFAPLPPKLPPKPHAHDEANGHVVEERSPRSRKVKIIYSHPDDEEAYPHVESPPPRRKRDSGKYYVTEPAGASGVPRVYERRRPDPEVQRLMDDLEREKRERREAEKAAAVAEGKAERLKADLAQEKRQRSLERRERAVRDRERRLSEEQHRLLEERRPRDRQDVVVVHNPPPATALPIHDRNRSSALDRAREDYRRTHPEHNHLRDDQPTAGIADRRPRRQSVIVVDGDEGRDRDRDRARRHR